MLLKHHFNFWVAGISKSCCLQGLAYENDKAPVVWEVDNAIHQLNHYPVDSVICSALPGSLHTTGSGFYLNHFLAS